MKLRLPGFLGLFALALFFSSCSSGGSGSSRVAGAAGSCAGAPAGSFCLTGCNLGCSGGGCGVTVIAVNQQLIMTFNRTVDPASVNTSTFSIKTSTGKRPSGEYTVRDNMVIFTPSVVVSSNKTSFGFDRGETYTLHIPGQDEGGDTIRSSNGFKLYKGLLCTLTASLGVIDPNNAPPEARMIVPAKTKDVDPDTLIVLEFSELLAMSTVTNPTAVDVYVSMGGGIPTLVQCQRFAQADPVSQKVQLTLKPSILLPPNSTVEVRVKGEIRDLAGKPAKAQVFTFQVKDTGAAMVELAEDFHNTNMRDEAATGAKWGPSALSPGQIGGSGILGPFDKNMFAGVEPKGGVLVLSTDSVTVKGEYTLTGQDITVTDGVFEFETFVVPKGLTIRFQGANVPKILVRGEARIDGKIEVNGGNAPVHNGMSSVPGKGGASNCGGGAGGVGAQKMGNGQDGAPVSFPKGSARYNSAAAKASAGKGSPVFPASASLVTYNGFGGWVSAQVAAGGAGGSNFTQGTKGYGTLTGSYDKKFLKTDVPPDNNPGPVFPYLPKLANEPSILQFLAGGSGGGGGGSSPVGSMKSVSVEWHTGQGGGAGGGALLIRCGGNIVIGQTGILEAAGGNSPNPQAAQRAMPGGGGSGGNILFQLGGKFYSQGKVWAPGGTGGKYTEMVFYGGGTMSQGGSGGYGYLRVEANPKPLVGELAGFTPAPTEKNVGLLTDSDSITGARSLFYQTRRLMPFFDHYEIEAEVNGKPLVYSDDPRKGTLARFDPGKGTPVAIFLQGAQVDSQGQPVSGTLTKWVTRCADLNELKNWFGGKPTARPTSVRWILLFDKSVVPAPGRVVVKKVTIFARG